MQTALTLTQANIDRMLRYAIASVDAIEVSRRDWIKDRERYERAYNGDLSDRVRNSGTFSNSNESLRIVSGGVEYIAARSIEAIFKVEPYFDATPRTKTGGVPAFAEELSRHLLWKLGPEQMDFQFHAEEEIKVSRFLGECVSKIVHETKKDDYERFATILVDAKGNPVLDDTGEFIFEEDGVTTVQKNDTQGNPISYQAPTGHPEIDLSDPAFKWEERIITDQNIFYIGAKSIPLHFKEFYCRMDAKSIQESDFTAHVTTLKLSVLCEQLGVRKNENGEFVSDDGGEIDAHIKAALDLIKTETPLSKAAGDEPRREVGESQEPITNDGDPEFRYVEAYMVFDAKDDGKPTRVFFSYAPDYELPIYWEYLSNVTPDGRYPFNAVVNDKEPGRWYGRSWFKKYEAQERLIDVLFNQILYRNHFNSNSTKFRRKEAVVQWMDGQPLEIGPDKVYDLNDGYSAKDALDFVEIPELDQNTKYLLETSIAAWRTSSGISTATEGTMGSMPAENTATGTQRIIASGNTLFEPLILECTRCLERELRMLVKCQYYYQQDESYTYKQNNEQLEGLLTRDMVRNLDLVVELKLTNLFATQKLQQAQLAANLANQFIAIPDQYKDVLRPIYEQIYQALQIDNATEIFQRLTEVSIQTAQAASQNTSSRVKISESIAFKDLVAYPEAQVEFMKEGGIIDDALAQEILSRLRRAKENEQPNEGTTAREGGAADGGNGAASDSDNDEPEATADAGQETSGTEGLPYGEMLQSGPQPGEELQLQGSASVGA